jgi:dephospho-CoA kinase
VVIDADQVARHVLAPGSPGERAVLAHFGPTVVGPHQDVDRAALARLVFSSPVDRRALEAITHPLIRDEVTKGIAAARAAGAQVVVVELPLLDGARRRQYALDVAVLVDAPEAVAVRRAVERGMPEADVRARMAAQPSPEERGAATDRVLTNDGGPTDLDDQVAGLWEWLLDLASKDGALGDR